MNDDELKKVWRSLPDESLSLMETSSMINEVQSDIKSWDKMLTQSKSMKGVMVIILVGWSIIFGMIAYTKPDIQSKFGAILCLILFGYIMIKMIGSKNLHQRNISESYLNYLTKIRTHLISYKRLYDVMLYLFYPLLATVTLLFRVDSFTAIGVLIMEFLIVIGFGIFFYFLHKWALKKFISVRLEKIEQLLESLER